MSVNRILCTEESLLITLNKILTGRECISLPVFYLIFSPDLGYNDSNRAYQMESNGNVVDYDWGIGNSYGMIYTINKKFKFRSPAPDYGSYDFSTYCVNSSGDGYSYWHIDISYGDIDIKKKSVFRSPYLRIGGGACQVGSDGYVDDGGGWIVAGSYGNHASPVLEVSIGVWCVDNFGANDSDDVWDVDYSYGNYSPNVHYGGAYFVIPDGAFGVDWYIGNSYGIFISTIYYECDIDILYITITFYFLEVLKYET